MTLFRRKFFQLSLLTSLGAVALTAMAADAPPIQQQFQFFESQVRPILERSCFKCHGAEAKIKGGLRLTSRAGLLKGGDTGPAIFLPDPSKSLLLKAISYKDEDLQMPPTEQLPREKIAILTQWVNWGAPWPAGGATEFASVPAPAAVHPPPRVTPETMKFWSYQPIRRPTVPQVKDPRWIRNPIDNFIFAKLEASGLQHAAPATKTALIRRAYYDLTGL